MDNIDLYNYFMEILGRFNDPLKSGSIASSDPKELWDTLFVPSEVDKPSPVSHLSFSAVSMPVQMAIQGTKTYYVGWTNSMEPTIDYADCAIAVPYDVYKSKMGEVKLGQICLYNYGKVSIIHRMVKKRSDGTFLFKGDNNKLCDAPVNESQITHVVIGIIYTNDKIAAKQD